MSDQPEIASALVVDGHVVRVCYQRCWSCITALSGCPEPAEWHTWADADDIAHAVANGRPDPSTQPCGCWCMEGVEQ